MCFKEKLIELKHSSRVLTYAWYFVNKPKYFVAKKRINKEAWNRISGNGNQKYNSLKMYKDIHKGERCFIIATGPSLTMEDLEALKSEYTFGMNSICIFVNKRKHSFNKC